MDLTNEEFINKYVGVKRVKNETSTLGAAQCAVLKDKDVTGSDATPSYDWRDHGAVTAVQKQGLCGSCYAFSTVGILEAQNAIKHMQLVELSAQEIIDCDRRSEGCDGGFISDALKSLIEIGGVMKSDDYGYTAKAGTCRFDMSKVAVKVDTCATYDLKSQDKLKQLLYKNGPVAVAVKANNFNKYKRGVFSDRQCRSGPVNHDALLVGYGTDPKEGPYWLVKNSYGVRFGEGGYIRIQRGMHAESCGMMNDFMATATIK